MTEKEQRSCEECGEQFLPKVHNGKYCKPECRRRAMNAKVLAKYHEKKLRKSSKKRICATKDCDTILSRYNPESVCEWCLTERLKDRLVSWGHDRESVDAMWRED